jgi:hypothetical protein
LRLFFRLWKVLEAWNYEIYNLSFSFCLPYRCILDGEMLVWDTSLNRFAEFGSNQEIAKAAREGLDSHKQVHMRSPTCLLLLFEDPTTNSDVLLSANAVVLYPYEEKLMPTLKNSLTKRL